MPHVMACPYVNHVHVETCLYVSHVLIGNNKYIDDHCILGNTEIDKYYYKLYAETNMYIIPYLQTAISYLQIGTLVCIYIYIYSSAKGRITLI